jgi:hypothetical protein
LGPSHRKGIITLIHKGKNQSRELLSNWRPITLTNVDYKIATKALAIRVQQIIYKIVDPDQTGYIKGRYIGGNARLIEDVLRYTETENLAGAIMFLDFSKAFDSIDKGYMIATLKLLNFGPSFIKWVETLYNDIESCIFHNGHVSAFFSIEKGVRQGCPYLHYYLLYA